MVLITQASRDGREFSARSRVGRGKRRAHFVGITPALTTQSRNKEPIARQALFGVQRYTWGFPSTRRHHRRGFTTRSCPRLTQRLHTVNHGEKAQGNEALMPHSNRHPGEFLVIPRRYFAHLKGCYPARDQSTSTMNNKYTKYMSICFGKVPKMWHGHPVL